MVSVEGCVEGGVWGVWVWRGVCGGGVEGRGVWRGCGGMRWMEGCGGCGGGGMCGGDGVVVEGVEWMWVCVSGMGCGGGNGAGGGGGGDLPFNPLDPEWDVVTTRLPLPRLLEWSD